MTVDCNSVWRELFQEIMSTLYQGDTRIAFLTGSYGDCDI